MGFSLGSDLYGGLFQSDQFSDFSPIYFQVLLFPSFILFCRFPLDSYHGIEFTATFADRAINFHPFPLFLSPKETVTVAIATAVAFAGDTFFPVSLPDKHGRRYQYHLVAFAHFRSF